MLVTSPAGSADATVLAFSPKLVIAAPALDRTTLGKKSKAFFSGEKKQKTFGPAVAKVLQRAPKRTKVFWFFFSKRTACLLTAGRAPV